MVSPSATYSCTNWIFPVVKKGENSPIEKVMKDPYGWQKVIKLIAYTSLFTQGAKALPEMLRRIAICESATDAFGVAGDVKVYRSKDFGKMRDDKRWETQTGFAGFITMAAADVGCTVLWVAELSMTELSNVSAAIGKVQIFGATPLKFIDKLPSLSSLSLGACWIAFILMTISNIGKIRNDSYTKSEQNKAWVSLAWTASEVVLKTLLVVGCASSTLIGGVGIVACVLGLRNIVWVEPETVKNAKGG